MHATCQKKSAQECLLLHGNDGFDNFDRYKNCYDEFLSLSRIVTNTRKDCTVIGSFARNFRIRFDPDYESH